MLSKLITSGTIISLLYLSSSSMVASRISNNFWKKSFSSYSLLRNRTIRHLGPYAMKDQIVLLMSSYRNNNDDDYDDKKKKKIDYIDAEIVEDNSKKHTSSSISSPLSAVTGIFKSAKDKISNIFSSEKDEKVSLSNKKKYDKEIDVIQGNIDEMFKNTGMVGGMFGSIIKSVAKPLITSVLNSMEESKNDINDVIRTTKRALQSDPNFINALGTSELELSSPIQTSVSSSSINGVGQTNIYLMLPFEGSYNNGFVEIQSTIPNNNNNKKIRTISLETVKVRFNNGKTMIIKTDGSFGNSNIIDV